MPEFDVIVEPFDTSAVIKVVLDDVAIIDPFTVPEIDVLSADAVMFEFVIFPEIEVPTPSALIIEFITSPIFAVPAFTVNTEFSIPPNMLTMPS